MIDEMCEVSRTVFMSRIVGENNVSHPSIYHRKGFTLIEYYARGKLIASETMLISMDGKQATCRYYINEEN